MKLLSPGPSPVGLLPCTRQLCPYLYFSFPLPHLLLYLFPTLHTTSLPYSSTQPTSPHKGILPTRHIGNALCYHQRPSMTGDHQMNRTFPAPSRPHAMTRTHCHQRPSITCSAVPPCRACSGHPCL